MILIEKKLFKIFIDWIVLRKDFGIDKSNQK